MDFSFIVSLYVSDLSNVTIRTKFPVLVVPYPAWYGSTVVPYGSALLGGGRFRRFGDYEYPYEYSYGTVYSTVRALVRVGPDRSNLGPTWTNAKPGGNQAQAKNRAIPGHSLFRQIQDSGGGQTPHGTARTHTIRIIATLYSYGAREP